MKMNHHGGWGVCGGGGGAKCHKPPAKWRAMFYVLFFISYKVSCPSPEKENKYKIHRKWMGFISVTGGGGGGTVESMWMLIAGIGTWCIDLAKMQATVLLIQTNPSSYEEVIHSLSVLIITVNYSTIKMNLTALTSHSVNTVTKLKNKCNLIRDFNINL